MSRIIALSTPKVKPTRKSARPVRPFGAGLFRFVASAVVAPGYRAPSEADRAAAAAMVADEPDWDRRAGEAAYVAASEALTPSPSTRCRSCGELAEINRAGYCDPCDDAGTEATIKGENGRAGLGHRVI